MGRRGEFARLAGDDALAAPRGLEGSAPSVLRPDRLRFGIGRSSGGICRLAPATGGQPADRIWRADILRRHALLPARANRAQEPRSRGRAVVPLTALYSGGCVRRSGDGSVL